ncbi:DNA ligase B [Striga asiatica]|uniref:DNA ligase B n=1 Tax=Striga asiatica TaxID=4170 RepID=A0A5A7PMM2_STRAF|nr:DNA ligase B [Striga asiatica]
MLVVLGWSRWRGTGVSGSGFKLVARADSGVGGGYGVRCNGRRDWEHCRLRCDRDGGCMPETAERSCGYSSIWPLQTLGLVLVELIGLINKLGRLCLAQHYPPNVSRILSDSQFSFSQTLKSRLHTVQLLSPPPHSQKTILLDSTTPCSNNDGDD